LGRSPAVKNFPGSPGKKESDKGEGLARKEARQLPVGIHRTLSQGRAPNPPRERSFEW